MVSSLAGAFGAALRETRLTALLGYLIALDPEPFLRCFRFPGDPLSVGLETIHARDRSDIVVQTTEGTGVIEAKVDATDPFDQVSRYPANWRVLLTQHIPSAKQRASPNLRYLRWHDLRAPLERLAQSANARLRFVSKDLLAYLEEHNMIRSREPVEIYAREINEEKTLALFLKGCMYGCSYAAGSRLPEALYFAPHFGRAIADQHPGVRVGISYIARIERVEVVDSWEDMLATTRAVRGKGWLAKHQCLLKPIHSKWRWKGVRYHFLYLSVPRLVFNPPVVKERLQTGHGWLSKRFMSFDELFEAWRC
ncbi:MAG TPA: hypothetical protein VNA25_06680 [Phycisphaerae bacterium]|nr:hypothetical protein [Phycisphaerae bacterium]